MTEALLAEEKYAAFVPHGVHTHAHSFFLLWLLFLQDKANHHLPSPPSLLYVVYLYFSVRKLRNRFSTYFGISVSNPQQQLNPGCECSVGFCLAFCTLLSFEGALSFLSKCRSHQFVSPDQAGLTKSLLSVCATPFPFPVGRLLSCCNQDCLVIPKSYTLLSLSSSKSGL